MDGAAYFNIHCGSTSGLSLILKSFSLTLYCSLCQSAVYLFLAENKDNQRREHCNDNARADVVVLISQRPREFKQRGSHRDIFVLVLQVKVCHIIFIVGAHTLQNHYGNDCRLQERKQNAEEYAKVSAAIHDGRLIQRRRQIFKILNKDIDRDNICPAHQDAISRKTVDPPQGIHNLIDRNLHGDARKQGSKEEQRPDDSTLVSSIGYIFLIFQSASLLILTSTPDFSRDY